MVVCWKLFFIYEKLLWFIIIKNYYLKNQLIIIINFISSNILSTVSGGGYSTPKDMDHLKPLLQMVFYSIDKIKRFRLSKEVFHLKYVWYFMGFSLFATFVGQNES